MQLTVIDTGASPPAAVPLEEAVGAFPEPLAPLESLEPHPAAVSAMAVASSIESLRDFIEETPWRVGCEKHIEACRE
jgi:hypothetical protein